MTLVWKKYQIFSRPAQIFLDALQIDKLPAAESLKLSVSALRLMNTGKKSPADVGSFCEIHRLIFR